MLTLPSRPLLIPIICSLLLCPARTATLTWRSIGPGGGGWLSAITVVNDQAGTVYVGCDVGGMYRSTDNGRTWQIKNRGLTRIFHKQPTAKPESIMSAMSQLKKVPSKYYNMSAVFFELFLASITLSGFSSRSL